MDVLIAIVPGVWALPEDAAQLQVPSPINNESDKPEGPVDPDVPAFRHSHTLLSWVTRCPTAYVVDCAQLGAEIVGVTNVSFSKVQPRVFDRSKTPAMALGV